MATSAVSDPPKASEARSGGNPPFPLPPPLRPTIAMQPQPFPMNRPYLLPQQPPPPPPPSFAPSFAPSPFQTVYQLAPVPWPTQNSSTLADQRRFFEGLQASAQATSSSIVPTAEQRTRDYNWDSYFYDSWLGAPTQAKNTLRSAALADEFALIPLANAPTSVEGPILQFRFQDVPRMRLNADQDGYLAGIAMAYGLLTGLVTMDTPLQEACRSFDIDEDTIAITETQLETLIYNLGQTQSVNIKPMLFTFPLHDRLMSIPLRLCIYGDITIDPKTGFKRALTSISPFNWRHALPNGENAFRLRGETPTVQELNLRKRYHSFLVRFYQMMWRSLTRLRVENPIGIMNVSEYGRFTESTLASLRPASQSVAVLEARVRALVAKLQLTHGVMFNTAQFYTPADEFKNIMHPLITLAIGRYLYFRLPQ